MTDSEMESLVDSAVNPDSDNGIIADQQLEVPTMQENNTRSLDEEATQRFSSASWFKKIQDFDITLAGLGGIGSWTALLLARLRPYCISIYDGDNVESVNLAGQFYGTDSEGMNKATAMAKFINSNSHYYVHSYNENFTEGSHVSPIMICGFDSMRARKVFFNEWLSFVHLYSDEVKSGCLFIDGRLSADELQIFCITGNDKTAIKLYQTKYLFDDSEAAPTICSFKQTAFMANMIAGLIVNCLVNFANNLVDEIEKTVPFRVEYNSDLMLLDVRM